MAKEKNTVTQKTTSPADFKTDEKESEDRPRDQAGLKRQETQAPESAPDEVPDKAKSEDAPSEAKERSGKHGESGTPPPGSSIILPGTGTITVMIDGTAETIARGKAFTPSAAVRKVLDEHRIPMKAVKGGDEK